MAPDATETEIERARRRLPSSPAAYDLYLRGLHLASAATPGARDQALALFDQAWALDPDFVAPVVMAMRGWSDRAAHGWTPATEATQRALDYARRAKTLDPDDAEALAVEARLAWLSGGTCRDAVAQAERAAAEHPNSIAAWVASGWVRLQAGQPEDALRDLDQAVRLNPRDPNERDAATGRAFALLQAGRDAEAAVAARTAAERSATTPPPGAPWPPRSRSGPARRGERRGPSPPGGGADLHAGDADGAASTG